MVKTNPTHGMPITLLRVAAISLTAGLTSGCADYLGHHEGVSAGVGDAIARNKALQMIDPWPVYAGNTHLPGHGKRLLVGMKTYQENTPETDTKTASNSPTGNQE